jgi:hypothetical protein
MSKVQELAMYHQARAVVAVVHERQVPQPMQALPAQQVKDLLVEIAVHIPDLTILEAEAEVLEDLAAPELTQQLAVTVELDYNLVLVEQLHIMQVVVVVVHRVVERLLQADWVVAVLVVVDLAEHLLLEFLVLLR